MMLRYQHKKNITTQGIYSRGFTIVEVLVSLSIFAIVVTISVGSLLTLIHANAKTQNAQLIMTNLTFALDSMTREIRTGKAWWCYSDDTDTPPSIPNNTDTQNCNDGTALSIFELSGRLTDLYDDSGNNGESDRITYFYNEAEMRIERKVGNDGADGDEWVPLTSSEVAITDMQFFVTGTNSGDGFQPKATIVIKGEIGNEMVPNRYKEFTIQTTVNQNVLDI